MFLQATRAFISFLSLFILFSGAHGVSAEYDYFEVDSHSLDLLSVPSRQVQPCRSWSFNTGGRGYICNSYEFSVNVPDAQRLNQTISHLEDRIRQLEAQLNEFGVMLEGSDLKVACKTKTR